MDKKNVQFSKTEILYEKGGKNKPLLAQWCKKFLKNKKKCYDKI